MPLPPDVDKEYCEFLLEVFHIVAPREVNLEGLEVHEDSRELRAAGITFPVDVLQYLSRWASRVNNRPDVPMSLM